LLKRNIRHRTIRQISQRLLGMLRRLLLLIRG